MFVKVIAVLLPWPFSCMWQDNTTDNTLTYARAWYRSCRPRIADAYGYANGSNHPSLPIKFLS